MDKYKLTKMQYSLTSH